MRLLSARLRDYRLHRDLAVAFDPRFTVIAGPNQSGKSTLAEALHRALFLPVKTGGELLKGMQSSPFQADPEVELSFEAASQRWILRKRFAAARGSVSLLDGSGRSLQGDAAEERLAELVGTRAVPRNRAAADQLRERWGHLWVWQGSADGNPLAMAASAYDHDRLVERLQAGADLGVISPLDRAVLEDIQARWSAIYTPGGASRAPQVRKGSPLQLARAAQELAQAELVTIEGLITQQAEAEQAFQQACETLTALATELPLHRQQRLDLQQRLARSLELEALIGSQQPLLDGVLKDLGALGQDSSQLQQEQQRIETLAQAQAPDLAALAELRQQLPPLEQNRQQALIQLEGLQQASDQAAAAARAIEGRLNRQRLLQEQERIREQLALLERLRQRFRELNRELEGLPPLDAAAVDRLRRLEAAQQAAAVRAESLSAGIELIRADRPVRLAGEILEPGGTRLLCQPALLQVGDDVELRLLPGGGTSIAQAAQALERTRRELAEALAAVRLPSLEAAATAERRRSDLLAERQQVLDQARASGEAEGLRQRLSRIAEELQELAAMAGDEPDTTATAQRSTSAEPVASIGSEERQSRLAALEIELRQARQSRDQSQAAQQAQQQRLQQTSQALEVHRQAISSAEQKLRERENQLLEARTRCEALLQRHGSTQALQQAITGLEQRRDALQAALTALRAELKDLNPAALRAEDQRLERLLLELEQRERQAREARIRAEERLHGDGVTDLQAEREQKLAACESRALERERLEKEAAMLSQLAELLEQEQNAMGSQYTAPILRRLGRHLAAVFPEPPEASLLYDARGGFQALQWRRGEEAAFRFEVLSTGAREQFAAALRVALAEVLAEAYDGSLPILFDDAFANSDPDRQAGVYRMLQQAGDQGLQVILLTCDPERSQGAGQAAVIQLAR